MEGDHGSAPVGALPCAQEGKGQSMRRALPFARLSVMALCFYGGPGFLHKHFWLRSSSLLSPRGQQQSPPPGCSPNPTFQHPAPPPALPRWWTPILG